VTVDEEALLIISRGPVIRLSKRKGTARKRKSRTYLSKTGQREEKGAFLERRVGERAKRGLPP